MIRYKHTTSSLNAYSGEIRAQYELFLTSLAGIDPALTPSKNHRKSQHTRQPIAKVRRII